MWNVIMKDIIPIFVIMLLGFYSGKRKIFAQENARIFNKLVLSFALPAALFISIVKADRHMLSVDLKLTIVSFAIIMFTFFWSYFGSRKFFKRSRSEAAICALITGSPTIGFLGFAVLDPIFGATASTGLVVAIISIVVNAVNIPIGLSILNPSKTLKEESTTLQSTTNNSISNEEKIKKEFQNLEKKPLFSGLMQPVAWAPILAVILVLIGLKFPSVLDPNFTLIAKANAGVAVFAAGLTLSGLKFQFDKEIIYNTFVKLILMPALLLIVGLFIKLDPIHLQMLVLGGALPPAFSGIIISSRYQIYVRTGTSSLALSVLLFIFTAPFWIWITKLVS